MSDADIRLIGNATRDVDLTFDQKGGGVAKFGVAVNKRVKQGDDWVGGETSFYNVTCFGTQAENVAASIGKGDRVIVVGRIEQRSWTTDDGEKRSGYEVIADEVAPSLRWCEAAITRNERRAES